MQTKEQAADKYANRPHWDLRERNIARQAFIAGVDFKPEHDTPEHPEVDNQLAITATQITSETEHDSKTHPIQDINDPLPDEITGNIKPDGVAAHTIKPQAEINKPGNADVATADTSTTDKNKPEGKKPQPSVTGADTTTRERKSNKSVGNKFGKETGRSA